MNTPAHLLLGAAVAARREHRGTLVAALAGGLAPDLSLYILAGTALFVLEIPPQIVFDELYFSDAWQTVFAVDNSVFVWGACLAAGAALRRPWIVAFAGAALLHLALDFPLHHDDGRPHFWPVTDWVYQSPVSYWDIRRGAAIIGPVEAALSAGAAVLIWRRFRDIRVRVVAMLLLLAELWVVRAWFFFPG